MIHVDMNNLIKVWYDMAKNNKSISVDKKVLFDTLDSWQRQELKNAYEQGVNDLD